MDANSRAGASSMSAVTFPASARRNATSKIASAPHRKNAAPAKLDSQQIQAELKTLQAFDQTSGW
jgi:hypothetical protein